MNYYEVLNLNMDCTMEQIKASYRKLVQIHHPDHSTGSNEGFKRINDAYRYLVKNHIVRNIKQKPSPVVVMEPISKYTPQPPEFSIWGERLSAEEKKQWIRDNSGPMMSDAEYLKFREKSIPKEQDKQKSNDGENEAYKHQWVEKDDYWVDIFNYENEEVPPIR